MVLLVGPQTGVTLVNAVSIVASVLVLVRVWADIDWATFLWLVVPAIGGIALGAEIARHVDAALLEMVVGTTMLLAILATVLARRITVQTSGATAKLTTGFLSGLASVTAGTSGPPVSVYASVSRWPQRAFVATVQPYFLTVSLGSVITKALVSPAALPVYSWWEWGALVAALIIGVWLGDALTRRIRPEHARSAMLVLAALGSLAVAVHGIFRW